MALSLCRFGSSRLCPVAAWGCRHCLGRFESGRAEPFSVSSPPPFGAKGPPFLPLVRADALPLSGHTFQLWRLHTVTPQELARFAKLLQEHRATLLAKDGAEVESGAGAVDRAGEDEQPLNEMLQSIASTRNKNAAETVRRIHRALVKLEQRPDEFGLCESCEEEIAPRRLLAMPWAELCVECQDKARPRTRFSRKTIFDFVD